MGSVTNEGFYDLTKVTQLMAIILHDPLVRSVVFK